MIIEAGLRKEPLLINNHINEIISIKNSRIRFTHADWV